MKPLSNPPQKNTHSLVTIAIRPDGKNDVPTATGSLRTAIESMIEKCLCHHTLAQKIQISSLAPLWSEDECLTVLVPEDSTSQLVELCEEVGLKYQRLDQLVHIQSENASPSDLPPEAAEDSQTQTPPSHD